MGKKTLTNHHLMKTTQEKEKQQQKISEETITISAFKAPAAKNSLINRALNAQKKQVSPILRKDNFPFLIKNSTKSTPKQLFLLSEIQPAFFQETLITKKSELPKQNKK